MRYRGRRGICKNCITILTYHSRNFDQFCLAVYMKPFFLLYVIQEHKQQDVKETILSSFVTFWYFVHASGSPFRRKFRKLEASKDEHLKNTMKNIVKYRSSDNFDLFYIDNLNFFKLCMSELFHYITFNLHCDALVTDLSFFCISL